MKRILLFAVIAVLLSSCNKFLDELPDNRAELISDEKIAQMLVSAYPTELPTQMFEYASDNMRDCGTNFSVAKVDFDQMFRFEDVSAVDWDVPTRVWQVTYRCISSANQALASIEERGNPERLDGVRAEALLCRAYGHFILAKTFCIAYNPVSSDTDMGVPYATAAETTVKPHYDRGTVSELYAKIYADIEEALPHIVDNYRQPKYHFNRKAAYAFAANFNLFYGKWDKVVDYATIALGDDPKSIMRDWEAIKATSPRQTDRYYAYLNIEDPANFMFLSQRSQWGRYFDQGSNMRYCHNQTSVHQTIRQTFPCGYKDINGFSHSGGQGVYHISIDEIWEEDPLRPGTGQPHTVLVPFNSEETLMCRAEAYAMLGEYDKSALDLSIWYDFNFKSGNYNKDEISDWYSQERLYSIYEDMHSRFLTSNEDMKANLVRACLAIRRYFGVHLGVRWPDMKRHGIRLTRQIWKNASQYETLVVEPYSAMTANQLPADVMLAGMPGNPRENLIVANE